MELGGGSVVPVPLSVPVLLRLAAMATELEALTAEVESGGLDHLDDGGLLAFWQEFEGFRNRMPVVEHRVVRDAGSRDLAGRYCQPSVARLMAQTLRIPAGEAARRARAAEQLGGGVSMLGEPQAPARPALAAAQRSGQVGPEQVEVVLRGLAKVDVRGFDPVAIAAGEELLTGYAATFGPKDLQVCVDRFVDTLDPDGSRPDEELQADRRFFELRAQRDGSWRGEFRLTGTAGAKLAAVLGPLARPRVSLVTTAGGRRVEEPDPRPYPQRMHDALEEICDRLLRAGSATEWGGVPATVIVTIDEESLRSRTGGGTTTGGGRLSTAAVLGLAGQAEVVPAVLDDAGAVLTLGRRRRIASRDQTLALVARDRGCSFPGCDRPPEWCERHHIRAWIDGGLTDLDNLTLLCAYHHHHFAARGWTCRLNPDRLPEWVPPRHVDRHQKPIIDRRILAAGLREEPHAAAA
ncbi:DUF222 domain-containing protein [uncultured Friedmanniella sp.]|uniref:HNH endonuclease signature motif containing protein n=1 Tax=uncultured Friedmanniella sp. TaxID=335381 RepID=UPI0035CBDA7C